MNIDQEIHDLLYRNNCVIVPSFGAFISSTTSSQLLENHNFIPPKKQIIFNNNIINNDGLLVNYIAQSKGISFEESTSLVQEIVTLWNNKLNLINKLYIKNVGSFIKNENNILIFNNDQSINFLTSSFGLSTIVSPTIEKNLIISKEILPEKVVKSINNQKNKIIINQKNNFWRIAAIFLIFISISTLLSIVYCNNTIEKKLLISEKKVNKKIEAKISEATFALPLLPFKNFVHTSNLNSNFYVIAGSFSKKLNAEKLQNQLIKNGYQATIIYRENKMFSVTYNSFSSEIEAEKLRKNIQKNSNPDAWVLQESK
jgi:hypothetical protein